ncbi:MAG: hypothetical protein H8F28_04095 [Fibrella sp.]|nr:hypothetical protein [Armatimonadota bacterium]
MIRPKVFNVFLFALVAWLSCGAVFAAEPTLETKSGDPLPVSVKQNDPETFTLVFKDADGDRIKSALMKLKTPSGESQINGTNVSNDTTSGVDVTWSAKMSEPGTYTATFIVSSTDGEVLYPAQGQDPYRFTVENLPIKWGIFAGGTVVSLLFLPYLTYVLFRSMNQRGDPSGAARGALLLGILLSAALFIFLFAGPYGPLAFGIGIIAALAGIVMVLTQKRR